MKPKRIKLTEMDIRKKVSSGINKRNLYLNPNKNSVEFIPPQENPENIKLFFDISPPYSYNGKLTNVFYIPGREHAQLIELFQ
jgi:hypothetical protein